MIIYELQLPLPELHPESVLLITADLEEGASYPKNGIRRVKKPSYMFIWVMSNIDLKVSKLVQANRSQEPSSFCLLLTS